MASASLGISIGLSIPFLGFQRQIIEDTTLGEPHRAFNSIFGIHRKRGGRRGREREVSSLSIPFLGFHYPGETVLKKPCLDSFNSIFGIPRRVGAALRGLAESHFQFHFWDSSRR